MEEQKEKGIWERAKYYIVLKRKLTFLGFLIWLCLLNLLGRFYRREMFFSAWIYAFLLLPLMIGIAVLSEKLENIVETILEKKMLNREEGNIWEKARNYLKHQATFMQLLNISRMHHRCMSVAVFKHLRKIYGFIDITGSYYRQDRHHHFGSDEKMFMHHCRHIAVEQCRCFVYIGVS